MTIWILVFLQKGIPEIVRAFKHETDAKKERFVTATSMIDEDDLIIFECELE